MRKIVRLRFNKRVAGRQVAPLDCDSDPEDVPVIDYVQLWRERMAACPALPKLPTPRDPLVVG